MIKDLPCTFDLRKYPFNNQICVLNVFFGSPPLLPPLKIRLNGKDKENEAEAYLTSNFRELGEFYLANATIKLGTLPGSVVFYLYLEGLYGYHVLNSFTPSALMLLISYSTLYFPIPDFNERIMVSLTSLLVLTALFTQTSDTSVRTSYFKYLDIWYVSMITFSFLIVMCNAILHSIWTNINRQKLHVVNDADNCIHCLPSAIAKARSRNAIRFCFLTKIFFPVSVIAFIAIFCIAAKGLF